MRKLTNYTLIGVCFGLCFPVFSWVFDAYVREMDFSMQSLWQIHIHNPLHWIIDSTPLILGGAFHLLGIKALQRHIEIDHLKKEKKVLHLNTSANESISLENTPKEWVRQGEYLLQKSFRQDFPKDMQSKKILSTLCMYLNAPMGCIYVTDERDELSIHAKFTKNKIPSIDFVQDKNLLWPQLKFMTTTEGSTSLLLLPISSEERTVGLLELASVQPFTTLEKELIEKAIELIAPTLKKA